MGGKYVYVHKVALLLCSLTPERSSDSKGEIAPWEFFKVLGQTMWKGIDTSPCDCRLLRWMCSGCTVLLAHRSKGRAWKQTSPSLLWWVWERRVDLGPWECLGRRRMKNWEHGGRSMQNLGSFRDDLPLKHSVSEFNLAPSLLAIYVCWIKSRSLLKNTQTNVHSKKMFCRSKTWSLKECVIFWIIRHRKYLVFVMSANGTSTIYQLMRSLSHSLLFVFEY